MPIVAKLDELGKPAWIALMILGFIVWWPLGFAILAYLIWSGRMGCGKHGSVAGWERQRRGRSAWNLVAAALERQPCLRRISRRDAAPAGRGAARIPEFLDRLRIAKDKTEFDQFMAERRGRSARPEPQPQS